MSTIAANRKEKNSVQEVTVYLEVRFLQMRERTGTTKQKSNKSELTAIQTVTCLIVPKPPGKKGSPEGISSTSTNSSSHQGYTNQGIRCSNSSVQEYSPEGIQTTQQSSTGTDTLNNCQQQSVKTTQITLGLFHVRSPFRDPSQNWSHFSFTDEIGH